METGQSNGPSADRRIVRAVRTVLLVVVLASAPVAFGADTQGPGGMRTEAEIQNDLEAAQATQARLAAQVVERQRAVTELGARQVELEGDIATTAAALEEINANLTAVRSQIVVITTRIEAVEAEYARLVVELAVLDRELVDLEAREAAKRTELQGRQADLAQRLRDAAAVDRRSLFEVLLTAEDFTEALSEAAWHLDVGQQDRVIAERIESDRATLVTLHETAERTRVETNLVRQATAVQGRRLEADRALLESTRAQLAKLEAATARELAAEKAAYEELARTRSDLEAAIAEGQAAQAELARTVSTLVEEEARRAAEEARLAEEARRRAEEARRRAEEERRRAAEAAERRQAEATRLEGIPSSYSGQLRWPLVGRITGEWGCSSYPGYGPGGPGCAHFHNGIDIARQCGSPVVAAGDGTVAYVGFNWADGPDPAWMVVVAHSGRLITWYAHLRPDAPDGIAVGAQVKAGQLIGWEGNTGRSTGCHLHWMVQFDGDFVNGRRFL